MDPKFHLLQKFDFESFLHSECIELSSADFAAKAILFPLLLSGKTLAGKENHLRE